jgi:hypothetical protein
MAGKETWLIRGENGLVIEVDVPLPEGFEQRLEKGYLTRVNADGTTWMAEAVKPADAPTDAAADVPAAPVLPPKPAANAGHPKWAGYAVRVLGLKPDDADAMTKGDLIEAVARHEAGA